MSDDDDDDLDDLLGDLGDDDDDDDDDLDDVLGDLDDDDDDDDLDDDDDDDDEPVSEEVLEKAREIKAKRLYKEENGKWPLTGAQLTAFVLSDDCEKPIEPESEDIAKAREALGQ